LTKIGKTLVRDFAYKNVPVDWDKMRAMVPLPSTAKNVVTGTGP
jgi:hypothetical protein